MKFTDGQWMLQPGVAAHYAAEAYAIEVHEDRLVVLATTRPIKHRGDTLQGPTLTVTLSSPLPGVIRVSVEHYVASEAPRLHIPMLSAARAAWTWAEANPQAVYRQPADIRTGDYGDAKLDDEFAWAGAELFVTTGEARYRPDLDKLAINVPSWGDVKGLAWITLAQHRAKLNQNDNVVVKARVMELAEELVARQRASAYRLAMQEADFNWGSNSQVLNQALMLIQAYRLNPKSDTLAAAQALFDHVLGRNPLGQSMVTGFGSKPPLHPHHRPSEADGVEPPVPGFLVGGPNPGQQDKTRCPLPYASAQPALSYLDHFCSYASNEIAINWNAPLVYVSAALQALTK